MKFELRNPKLETIFKARNAEFWISDLFRVSTFEFRIFPCYE
jgi:hypothetical protein